MANSEYQDEMPHNAAFHQGLHCLPKQKQSLEKEIQNLLKIIYCDPSIYTTDNSEFIECCFMENFISL